MLGFREGLGSLPEQIFPEPVDHWLIAYRHGKSPVKPGFFTPGALYGNARFSRGIAQKIAMQNLCKKSSENR